MGLLCFYSLLLLGEVELDGFILQNISQRCSFGEFVLQLLKVSLLLFFLLSVFVGEFFITTSRTLNDGWMVRASRRLSLKHRQRAERC